MAMSKTFQTRRSAVLFQQILLFVLAAFFASAAEALVKSIHAPNAPDSLTAKYYLNEYQHVAGLGGRILCAAISPMTLPT